MKREKGEKRRKSGEKIVLLEDLAPRKVVKGGAGKIVFGASAAPFLEVEEKKQREKK